MTTTTTLTPPIEPGIDSATASSVTPPGTRWRRRFAASPNPQDLAQRAALAEQRLPLQGRSAIYEALGDHEIDAEVALREWMRSQLRRQRRRAFRDEIAALDRDRKTGTALARHEETELHWHRRARAQQRRETNPDALEGMLHRRATRSSWRLRGVMAVGLVWSAVNVGRNLTPDGPPGEVSWWLLWALSFGIEAMISVPILEIMAQAATAARLGITVQRTKIVLFEAVLLGSTVGLNSGPHVAAGDLGRAAEFSVAPIMVVVLMWLHAWLTARNAEMIAAITARRTETAARESSAPNNQNIGSITDTADHAATSPGRMAPSPATPHPVHASPVTTIAARASKPVVLTAPYRTVDSPVAASAEFAERPTSHPQAGAAARADTDTITTVAVDPCGEIAEQLVLRKLARKPASQIVALLQLAAQGHNTNHITNQMSEKTATPWARSTVDRIITRAGQLGFDPASVQQEVAA